MQAELTILKLLNGYAAASAGAADVVVFVGHYFPPIFVGIAALLPILLAPIAQRREKIWLALEALGAGAIARFGVVALIRFLYHRPRPFEAHQEIVELISRSGSGFPSGHAAFLFAFSTVAWFANRRLAVWLYAFSTLVCIARIAGGVHYPTDILGGVVVGVLTGVAAHRLIKKFF